MRIVCFSTHSYDRDSLQRFNAEGLFAHDIVFLEAKLTEHTVRPAEFHSALTTLRRSLPSVPRPSASL